MSGEQNSLEKDQLWEKKMKEKLGYQKGKKKFKRINTIEQKVFVNRFKWCVFFSSVAVSKDFKEMPNNASWADPLYTRQMNFDQQIIHMYKWCRAE